MNKLRKGSQAHVVYSNLTQQFQRTDTLQAACKIDAASLSSVLTTLRRRGLAEYSGTPRQEGGLRWRRHPIDKPLYPAQADVCPRKAGGKRPKAEPYTDICERIGEDMRKLRWIISQQEKKLAMYEEIKAKMLGEA